MMTHQQTLAVDTELIGDFRIIDLLGSGGFANTYLAEDLTLGREVAIKEFFPSELAIRADSQSVSVKSAAQKVQFDWAKGRFVREAKTLAKFRHPSVVRVFRVFNANDTAYIVLEFVRGANMETWLKRIQRRPDQDELDHFLPPLLDALEVVHDAGILHRDIKPANIYIREVERTPVLLDFGAAKYAASTAGDQTATTAAIVSKGYSPHEAYSTDAQLQGPWTDIYGLAATLHRALTGSAPMESTTRIMQDDFVPLGDRPELAGRYRPEFLASLNRALAVMPKDRPRSIAEWRRELYPHLAASATSSASTSSQSSGAEWHPLSDTPSDATTLYTGGSSHPSTSRPTSSRPSAVRVSGPASDGSAHPSTSRGGIVSEVSAITEATRLAVNRMTKGASRAVLTGWALAATGAAGLALPLVLNALDNDEPNVAATRSAEIHATAPAAKSSPTPATRSNTKIATGGDVDATAKRLEADREKQRTEWQRQRLALQAEAARKKAEDLSQLAARRTAERKAREEEQERQRLAKLAEEKRQREEQQRLAEQRAAEEREKAQKLAAEKAAAEKAEAEERERQRIAAQKAEEERRQKEEQERQRLAAEQAEREERRKAAEAAREQERQRLARRAEAAEKARAERAKREDAARERKYAALNPTPSPSTSTEIDRKSYLTKVQSALKDGKCYAGELNGDLKETEGALSKFNSDFKGEAKPLQLASATTDEYETWLTWFRSLENSGCRPSSEQLARPTPSTTHPSKTKTYKARTEPKSNQAKPKKSKSARTKSRSKKSRSSRRASKKRSYGSGNSSQSLLRGTR